MSKIIQELENRIVRRMLNDAAKAGYDFKVYDGESDYEVTPSVAAVMKDLAQLDDAKVYFMKGAGKKKREMGWVYLVYGNDGYDVISDYSLAIEPVLKGALALAEKYE